MGLCFFLMRWKHTRQASPLNVGVSCRGVDVPGVSRFH